ncbi:unnamed protein product [Urochloa humidicola]
MTDDFSGSQEISRGELGVVYKGVTTNGELIAVKRLFDLPGLDDKHIKREFGKLSLLKHPNLVRFLSYCYEAKPLAKHHSNKDAVNSQQTSRALCFEYLYSDSLQMYLSDEFHGLDWHTRYKIIKGTCEGLYYLYEGLEEPIYHLDLNPHNILLDEDMTPKLAYFGFSKIFGNDYLADIWDRPPETLKYCPPEYIQAGTVSKEFDVFSLGAVIIMILTGQAGYIRISNRSSQELVDLTVKNWNKRLQQTFRGSRLELCCHQVKKCMEVAFRCVEENRHKRLSIVDATYALNEMDGIIDRMEGDPRRKVKVVQSFADLSVGEDSTRGMDDISIDLKVLECIVDGSKNPSNLKLPILELITKKFSNELRIGNGGCGVVYKGILQNKVIAVKKLNSSHTIEDRMFHQEVQSLMMVKHQNIVRFLGYCSHTEEKAMEMAGKVIMVQIRERLLCFDYMANGSLENHLTDELRGLEWHTRYEIIYGICEGLHHLHKEKHIIHMDLKPANILLDDHMVPKITDFGLARLDDKSQTMSTERLISVGYCAPEYMFHGKMSAKSDIYSLGVIIMELITGSKVKPNITNVLRRWNHRWNKSEKVPSIGFKQVASCLDLALRCMHTDPIERPNIWDIIRDLDKMDTTDVHNRNDIEYTNDRISFYLGDMLGIEPLQVLLPFELNKQIPITIQLANDTYYNFAFRIFTTSLRPYLTDPNRGIVKRQTKLNVTITLQAQKKAPPLGSNCKDEFSVQSTRVKGSITALDITADMFSEERVKVVDNVTLMVILDIPPTRKAH